MPQEPIQQFFDANQLAVLLHICRKKAAHLIKTGEIKSVNVRRRSLVAIEELRDFIERNGGKTQMKTRFQVSDSLKIA